MQAQGFLRGSKIIATRSKKVKNARVNIISRGLYEQTNTLPAEPDILPVLFHIWGLKPRDDAEGGSYDRDSLPESERPRAPRLPPPSPDVAALAGRVGRDLPGQRGLFKANGEKLK